MTQIEPPSDSVPEPDETFYDRVGGMATFRAIVSRFYEGIVSDELLRPLYEEEYLADGSAAERLTLFLAQFWGGPTTYSDERGHPRLRMRHEPYPITVELAERWLSHFRDGMESVELTESQYDELWDYVLRAAHFLVNA